MVFLATTLEPKRISHRAIALSVRSMAEGISRPTLASGATSTPDPRVNFPDASAFVERHVLTGHGSSQLLTVKIRQPSHEFTFGVGMSFILYPLVLTPVV
jgi:hypothetical protein